jgi:hypothetical protein
MNKRDIENMANLLSEMYSPFNESYLDAQATSNSSQRTGENQNEVSSIVYKNEGGPMGGSYLAALEKEIKQTIPKRYKGSVPKGYGTTELFFYGSSKQAEGIIDTFMRKHPPTQRANYSLTLGQRDSSTNYQGDMKDPETGATGRLFQ